MKPLHLFPILLFGLILCQDGPAAWEEPEAEPAPVPRFPSVEDFKDIHAISVFKHNDGAEVKHYEEFFDFETKRGRLDVMVEGLPNEVEQVSTFYSSGSSQVIEIRNIKQQQSCRVERLDLSKLNVVEDLVDYDAVGGVLTLGPLAIWKFIARRMNGPKPLQQTLGGKATIRGREVSIYRFTDNEKEVDGQVGIYMYFIETAGKITPLRFEIYQFETDLILVDTFEFLLIEDYLDEATQILPAVGIGCPGYKSPEKFESVVEQMSFLEANKVAMEVEIVEQVDGVNLVHQHQMMIDNLDQLFQLQNQEGDNEITYIEDLRRGVTYVQMNGEECEMDPLERSFVSYRHSLSYAKGLRQILSLDGDDFYYLGKTKLRGLDVQIWEQVRKDYEFNSFDLSAGGDRYAMAVITHFLTDKLDVDQGSSSIVPVQTLLTGYAEVGEKLVKKFTQEINYFEFGEVFTDDVYHDTFDVSNCFPDDTSRAHLDMFLKSEGAGISNHSFALIERMVARQIAVGADISILRVPRVEVSSAGHFSSEQGSGFVLNVLLLERPPLMLYFKNMSSALKPHVGDEKLIVSSEDCARLAIRRNNEEETISGFFYCGDTCYLTNWTLSDAGRDSLTEDRECMFFERNVMNKEDLSRELSLTSLVDLLFNLTASGSLSFTLEKQEGVSESFVVDDLIVASPRQELVRTRSFALTKSDYTLTEDQSTVAISGKSIASMADCEAACDQEVGMLCESFAFCKSAGSAGRCILTPKIVTSASSSDEVQESKSCSIFTRTYKSLFFAVEGGILTPESDVVKQISSVEECARTCSMYPDFKCQSFAFCGSTHCVLKKAHAFTTATSDVKEKQEGIECDLFTAKHFWDYVPTANVIVGGDTLQRLSETTPGECTEKCTALTGCRSVNYCHESVKSPEASCSLMSLSPTDVGAPRSRHPGCWNYRSESQQRIIVALPSAAGTSGGYSGGRLTWLVLGMILTGIVLGVVGVFAYGYARSRSDRSGSGGGLGLSIPSVRWTRQRNEE